MTRNRSRSSIWMACAVLLLVLAPSLALGGKGGLQPRPELLVSVDWLAGRLDQPNLRIVDLRSAKAYRKGHIRGAVHFPARLLFARVGGVEGMLPPVARVAGNMGKAGIGPETVVVAYDDSRGLYAARLFWALDYIGQSKGRLLDGGWPLWLGRGLSVSTRTPRVTPLKLTPRPLPERIAVLKWMEGNIKAAGTLYVDARSTWEYRGITKYSKFRGHIPGAVSMEWKRHLRSDGTMRPPGELVRLFKARGITPDKKIAVYCQIMVRAAHSYFVLKWLGFPQVRGYDGSWAEWGNLEHTPKELF